MFMNPSKRRQIVGLLVCAVFSACAVLATGQTRAAVGGDKKGDKDDIQRFQGSWSVAKASKNGEDVPEEILKDIKVTFSGDKFVFAFMGQEKKASIKLDATKKPKEIDIKFEDGQDHGYGIYEIDGDTVKIALGETMDKRAKDFKGGEGAMLITLKKNKEEPNDGVPASAPQGGRQTDKDKLKGSWTIASGTKGGQDLPADLVGKIKLTFDGDDLTIGLFGMDKKGTYKLNEKAKPREIDMTIDDKTVKGIFEIDGEKLKICFTEDNAARPTEFKSEAGSTALNMVFNRDKVEKKDDNKEEKKTDRQQVPAHTPGGKSDKDKLKGTWVITAGTNDGKDLPADLVGKIKFTFEGDKVTAINEAKSQTKSGTYKVVDEKANPRQIDLTFEDKTGQGIYEIDGDTLKICFGDPGKAVARPKDFKAEAGSGLVNIALKREKAEKKEPRQLQAATTTLREPGDDKKNIQGTWRPTKFNLGDKKIPDEAKQFIDMIRIEFKDGKVSFTIGDFGAKEGTYKIDPGKTPGHIDITIDDQKVEAIYELKGNKLKIAGGEQGKGRPESFDDKKAMIIEMNRVDDCESQEVAFVQPPARPAGGKEKKADKELIQGDWSVESVIDDGTELPAEIRDIVKFNVKDDKITVNIGELALKGTYTVDERKKPKTVDIKFEGGMGVIGIYEMVDDNKVRFCIVDSDKIKDRPTEFKSAAGSGAKLIVLKRATKEEKKAPAPVAAAAAYVAFVGGKEKSDKDLIQGEWKVTSALFGGMKPPEADFEKLRISVKGDKISITMEGMGPKDATFTLDPAKKPKQMDVMPADGIKVETIYEVSADTLKICGVEGGPRPSEFKSDAGTQVMLLELKRVTDKKDTEEKKKGLEESVEAEFVVFVESQDKVAPPAQEKKEQPKKDDPPVKKNDLDRIAGAWKLLKARGDGDDAPPDFVGPIRMQFEPDGTLNVTGAPSKDTGTWKIDDSTSPRQITLKIPAKKETIPGIYKFDGTKLVLCFADPAMNKERPKEFSADKGTKQILFVLEQTQTAEEVAKEKVEGNERADRMRSQNNLKQIGLAFHNYHDTMKTFPAHAIYSKDGRKPLLSWRVAILPYIEQQNLYQQFKLDEPWDSDHNKKLIAQMPKTYEPLGRGRKGEGLTYYQVFTGKDTLFDGPKGMKITGITDGTSNTILVVEAKNPVIWSKPDDLVLPPKAEKLPEIGGMFQSGMNLLFCDGSVRWVRRELPSDTLRAIITPNGGEVINDPDIN